MAIRFEVILNGKRLCTSGINGDGVLSTIVNYVKHSNEEPTCELRIGGLGHYHPTNDRQQQVSWPKPEIGVGDEITIRILPAGDFDDPHGMTGDPFATIDDSVFGHLDYHIDAWDGDVPFDCPPFQSAHVHLWASASGPSDAQRSLFREFINRHDGIWPQIADALVRCHRDITSVDELTARINPRVCIDIQDDVPDMELSYSVSGDPEYREYFVKIRDWEIVEIGAAD